MMNRPLIFSALLLCASASACAPLGRGVERIGNNLHEESVAMDHKVRDWFDSENIEMRKEREAMRQPQTAFCYKTLGEVSCYDRPIPGEERRLVGMQMPEPAFDEINTPVPESKPVPPVMVADAPAASDGTVTVTTVTTSEVPAAAQVPDYRKPRELIPVFK